MSCDTQFEEISKSTPHHPIPQGTDFSTRSLWVKLGLARMLEVMVHTNANSNTYTCNKKTRTKCT